MVAAITKRTELILNKRHYSFLSNYISLGFHRGQEQGIITNMWCATAAPPRHSLDATQRRNKRSILGSKIRPWFGLRRRSLLFSRRHHCSHLQSGPAVQEDERVGEPDRSLSLPQDTYSTELVTFSRRKFDTHGSFTIGDRRRIWGIPSWRSSAARLAGTSAVRIYALGSQLPKTKRRGFDSVVLVVFWSL
jgi:hypothetical protein